MEKKKNILVVHNYYQIPGGEDTVVANEVKMLEEHGHEVTLYTRKNSEINELPFYRKMLLPFTSIFSFRSYREVKRIIRDKQIDIVHVHNTLTMISPSVYYAALACKVPVVQTIHNFRLLCPNAIFYRDGHICEDCLTKGLRCAVKHRCYRGSRLQTLACVINTKIHRMTGIYGKIYYICLTEFNKEKLLNLKCIKPERVFVKPNFVDSINEVIPAEQRVNQFVYVGRLDQTKGVDILFEFWKQMGEKAPKLIVCGTGPMQEWCESFVVENSCNIELKGFLTNEEIRSIVSCSKALILPTRLYEGIPMSILEAYSVGTPVIAPNYGNCNDIVVVNDTGWKFSVFDDLLQCVQYATEGDLCESVRKHFDVKYSQEINYETIDKIYHGVKV